MAIDIELQPSRYLAIYLVAAYALALLSLVVLNVFWWWKVLLALLVSGYFIYAWHHYVMLNSSQRPSRLTYQNGQWQVMIASEFIPLELKHATVWRYLITLQFCHTGNNKAYHLAILPDSCDQDDFRRLRVLLRFSPVLTKG